MRAPHLQTPPATPTALLRSPTATLARAGALAALVLLSSSCNLLARLTAPRPPPPPAACPTGSIEAMKGLGIRPGEVHPVAFSLVDMNKPVAVREGPGALVTLVGGWEKLPAGTLLYGQLLFSAERVYGRFSEARLPEGGKRLSVCLQLVESNDWRPGALLEPGSSASSARIWPASDVEAASRFE